MCCLFGYQDYGHLLSRKQRSTLLTILSTACEERGTDATGIAYNVNNRMRVFKRPLAAHRMWYRVPVSAISVMGHTRWETQGSSARNWNNHPFSARVGGHSCALAHNGMLHNDRQLREKLKLPATRIETDSYVALQILEQRGELSFDSLRFMAEQLEGSFTITALSDKEDLYFVVGNNPMCLLHFPEKNVYVYASTDAILQKALKKLPFELGKAVRIHLYSGDMLRIDQFGNIERSTFDDSKLYPWFDGLSGWSGYDPIKLPYSWEDTYIEDLKAIAPHFGWSAEDIDDLLSDGICPEEIEELFYCG